jgi:hypothetical protein
LRSAGPRSLGGWSVQSCQSAFSGILA